ncbi:MAG: hypothetical protein R3E96_15110 [Planctomycetota bacterium]
MPVPRTVGQAVGNLLSLVPRIQQYPLEILIEPARALQGGLQIETRRQSAQAQMVLFADHRGQRLTELNATPGQVK